MAGITVVNDAIDAADYFGTPLHVAIECNNPDGVAELVSCGADVNVRTVDSLAHTPLHRGCAGSRSSCVEAVRVLLDRSDAVDCLAAAGDGVIPLSLAIISNSVDVVRIVLQAMKHESSPLVNSASGALSPLV